MAHRNKRGVTEYSETEIDYSPSSGAKDTSDALQDSNQPTETASKGFNESESYIGGELPSMASNADIKGSSASVPFYDSLDELDRRIAPESTNAPSIKNERDYLNDCRIWGTHIGLTETEIERTTNIVKHTESDIRNRFGMDSITLATFTLAANKESCSGVSKVLRKSHMNTFEDEDEIVTNKDMVNRYEELRKSLDISRDRISTVRKVMRQKL